MNKDFVHIGEVSKEQFDACMELYNEGLKEREGRGNIMCKDGGLETQVKDSFNVLDCLSSEARFKLEEAIKTRGSNILVLGKPKTGVSTALLDILELLNGKERVAVLTREDTLFLTSVAKRDSEGMGSQRNVFYVAPPMDVEVSPFVFKFAPFAIFVDSLSLFKNSSNMLSRGFKSNESSFISTIQLPIWAENQSCNARGHIKEFIANNFDSAVDIVDGVTILVVGVERKDGKITAYTQEVKF